MSFAVSSVALMGAGVAMNTIGSYFNAQSQKSTLEYQAGISDTNARLSELSAQSSLRVGQKQQEQILLKGGQIKSSQRASMAANGIDLGSDTAVNIQASTDLMAQSDALTINANAVQTAENFRTQKVNYENDARMKRATASGINPDMIATATFLEGAGKVAGSWYMMKNAGAFGSTK